MRVMRRDGENNDEQIKKYCQPKVSATIPELGDNNDLVKDDIEIRIA